MSSTPQYGTALSLEINEPNFLHARIEEVSSGGAVLLHIYSSPIVREDDPMYRPVAELLAEHEHDLVIEDVIPDPNMMFGQAILKVFRIAFNTREEINELGNRRAGPQERFAV